jgi:predicted RNase H-like nuclease
MWLAGIDGCKAGWICASRNTSTGELRFDLMASAAALLDLPHHPEVLCIDIPIGLPDCGGRECDREARRLLGRPRGSSVFPAPIRPALKASTREEASRITERADGRRVGAQAWALHPKIRAVDELLASRSEARTRLREVHPEVSFWAWNEGRAIQAGKKTPDGKKARLRLVEAWLSPGLLDVLRKNHRAQDVGDDDVLDAIAALWTAARVADGSALTLPAPPPLDAVGLRMEIVY